MTDLGYRPARFQQYWYAPQYCLAILDTEDTYELVHSIRTARTTLQYRSTEYSNYSRCNIDGTWESYQFMWVLIYVTKYPLKQQYHVCVGVNIIIALWILDAFQRQRRYVQIKEHNYHILHSNHHTSVGCCGGELGNTLRICPFKTSRYRLSDLYIA